MAALSPAEPTWPIEPDQAVAGERPVHLPGAKLRSAVGVQDAAVHRPAAGDGHLDRGDDGPGLHALVDGPADDPVREQVLDRAEVELALAGAVLGQAERARAGDRPVGRRRRTRRQPLSAPEASPPTICRSAIT